MTITKVQAKLFIEGYEIPFQNLNISASVGRPSTATITLAPSNLIKNIKPRSHIIILFLENNSEWKILWDGEFRGWNMSKSTQGLNFDIMAVDNSNAFSFMTRHILDGYGLRMQDQIYAAFHTGQNFRLSGQGTGRSGFVQEITNFTKESNDGNFGDLLRGIIEIAFDSVPYFSYSNERLKLIDRILALPDENIKNILTNSVAADYMQAIVQNHFTGNVSFEVILNYLLDIGQYVRCPIVGPPANSSIAHQMLIKPRALFSTPPACNCFFPGMYSSHSGYGIDYFSEPTRILLQTETYPGANGDNWSGLYFFNESDLALQDNNTVISRSQLVKDFISDDS